MTAEAELWLVVVPLIVACMCGTLQSSVAWINNMSESDLPFTLTPDPLESAQNVEAGPNSKHLIFILQKAEDQQPRLWLKGPVLR